MAVRVLVEKDGNREIARKGPKGMQLVRIIDSLKYFSPVVQVHLVSLCQGNLHVDHYFIKGPIVTKFLVKTKLAVLPPSTFITPITILNSDN